MPCSKAPNNLDENTIEGLSTIRNEPRPPTIAFSDPIKSFFREWIEARNNRALFDSAKRTRYRWFLSALEAPIHGTKEEKQVKFNERNDALRNFLLIDNQLYRKALKEKQQEQKVVFDYNAADMIEKVHYELEHAGNHKTF